MLPQVSSYHDDVDVDAAVDADADVGIKIKIYILRFRIILQSVRFMLSVAARKYLSMDTYTPNHPFSGSL